MRFLLTSSYLFLALKKSFTNAAWNEVLAVFCYVLKQNSGALKKAKNPSAKWKKLCFLTVLACFLLESIKNSLCLATVCGSYSMNTLCFTWSSLISPRKKNEENFFTFCSSPLTIGSTSMHPEKSLTFDV